MAIGRGKYREMCIFALKKGSICPEEGQMQHTEEVWHKICIRRAKYLKTLALKKRAHAALKKSVAIGEGEGNAQILYTLTHI